MDYFIVFLNHNNIYGLRHLINVCPVEYVYGTALKHMFVEWDLYDMAFALSTSCLNGKYRI